MIWTTFKDKSRIVSIPVTNFGSQLTALFVNVRTQNSFQERKKNGTLKAQRSTEPTLPWKMPLHRYQSIHGLRLCPKTGVWKRAQRQSLKNPKMGFVIKHLNNLYHNRGVKELSWATESFPTRWWYRTSFSPLFLPQGIKSFTIPSKSNKDR